MGDNSVCAMSEIVDRQLTQLCKENGLLKKTFLRAIGSTPERYASKLKHNHFDKDDQKQLLAAIRSIGVTLSKFEFSSTDNYSDIEQLRRIGIKKIKLAEIAGIPKEYVGAALERKKVLPGYQIQSLKAFLKNVSKRLEQFSFH